MEWAPCYCSAKAALDQITVQMAGTLIHKGIRVNAVNPGIVVTNIFNNAGMDGSKYYEKKGYDREVVPLGRPGAPADIAKLILFLADRSQSEFIIGQRYTADGGSVLKLTVGMQ